MKRILIVITCFLLALTIISCSAPPTPMPMLAPTRLGMAVPTAAPPAPRGLTDSEASTSAASVDRMIVYNVSMSLEVQDADKTVSDITDIVTQYKGYVVGTNLSRDSKGRMRGAVTVRVPVESLDAAQKQLEATGLKVLSRNRSSNDVTDQYTDLDARLKNLTAAEGELRTLLATVREKTGKAEDILAVYNQLTQIRGQIEQIKGQMNVLSKTSALATLTIDLTPHEEVTVVEPGAWLPNQTAREALRALVQALQTLADVAIWILLFFAPLLVVAILPIVLLMLAARFYLRRRSKAKPLVSG